MNEYEEALPHNSVSLYKMVVVAAGRLHRCDKCQIDLYKVNMMIVLIAIASSKNSRNNKMQRRRRSTTEIANISVICFPYQHR